MGSLIFDLQSKEEQSECGSEELNVSGPAAGCGHSKRLEKKNEMRAGASLELALSS